MKIGIDFDNTLISYHDLFYKLAKDRNLVPDNFPKNKTMIRNLVRSLSDGEVLWQRLQALAYGPEIAGAVLPDGIKNFFSVCKEKGLEPVIVSHKTCYAKQDEGNIDLRRHALEWMQSQSFFERNGFGLKKQNVYFESTREEKVNRIKVLQCTHFIDDLIELFQEPDFPDDVIKILYLTENDSASFEGIKIFSSWFDIKEYLFGY